MAIDKVVSAQQIFNAVFDQNDIDGPNTGELRTQATVTINPGDIQIGAVEIKDGTTDNRATVDGSLRLHVALIPKRANETQNQSATNIDLTSAMESAAHDINGVFLTRTGSSEAITVEVFLVRSGVQHLIRDFQNFTGSHFAFTDKIYLEADTQVRLVTTGVTAGTLDATIMKETF